MFNLKSKIKSKKGFSLVELVIGTAVFLIIVVSVYNSYVGVFNIVHASRAKIEAVSLINERLEIVRNLPYSSVGIVSGIPSGVLVHSENVIRDSYQYQVLTTVRNFDDPFDGTLGGTPNDLSPADSKIVEIEVGCTGCKNFVPIIITTRVSPKNLETASTNGALFIRVFNANGDPVEGANVHIENNQVVPPIIIDDVTNNSGMLQIVDAPTGINAYEVTVSKQGFSTDKTLVASITNPNPSKPHATVVLQQVTQLSFVIDRLSTFNISSITDMCNPVSSFNFSLKGSKLIGTNPDVLKYDQNKTTNENGEILLNNVEWDAYFFAGIDSVYDIVGTNPLIPIGITPGNTQNVQLIVAPKNPNTLLVVVKDVSTNLPLSGVSVTLTKTDFSQTGFTGQGFMNQTDWSGGGGQATSTNKTMYLASDGNLETVQPIGDILLNKVFNDYVSNGVLTSSSFDTGSASNFQQIDWTPIDQPVDTGSPNVRIQIATNNDGGTWNFNGPDGTNNSYYTVANKNIHSSNNGNRYLRYKLFLNSAVSTVTPNISNIFFTFTFSCTPPGQVSFSGLSNGIYNLHLEKAGYVSQDIEINIDSSWMSKEVVLTTN